MLGWQKPEKSVGQEITDHVQRMFQDAQSMVTDEKGIPKDFNLDEE